VAAQCLSETVAALRRGGIIISRAEGGRIGGVRGAINGKGIGGKEGNIWTQEQYSLDKRVRCSIFLDNTYIPSWRGL